MKNGNLAEFIWDCRIVRVSSNPERSCDYFTEKLTHNLIYRRKIIYNKLKRDIVEVMVIKELCKWKKVEFLEGKR